MNLSRYVGKHVLLCTDYGTTLQGTFSFYEGRARLTLRACSGDGLLVDIVRIVSIELL